jgi:hypothetical protein
MKGFPDPFEFWPCALRIPVKMGYRNRFCDVRPCSAKCRTSVVVAGAASDSESENLEAVPKTFACAACARCPAKLEYVATSRMSPGSRARKRGDNSVPFGGGSYSARRRQDVPEVVDCFVGRTKRVQKCQWGSPHAGPVLQVTTDAKSGRRSEVACWQWGRLT